MPCSSLTNRRAQLFCISIFIGCAIRPSSSLWDCEIGCRPDTFGSLNGRSRVAQSCLRPILKLHCELALKRMSSKSQLLRLTAALGLMLYTVEYQVGPAGPLKNAVHSFSQHGVVNRHMSIYNSMPDP